jgi:hypothetical protein
LDLVPANAKSDSLGRFCQTVISLHGTHWPPGETTIAEEFVRIFELGPFYISFAALRELCSQLRIETSVAPLPSGIRGHNSLFDDKRTIVISSNQDFPGADEHTLLHEFRELLEYEFEDLDRPTITNDNDREKRAELFASAVRANAIMEMLPGFVAGADQIKSKWFRYGAYGVILMGALFCGAVCIFLPQLEGAASRGSSGT